MSHIDDVADALEAKGLEVSSWAQPVFGDLREPTHMVRYHGRQLSTGASHAR